MRKHPLGHWLLMVAVVGVVFFATIGITMIDGPGTMRDKRLDAQRVAQLSNIVSAFNY